MPAGSGSFTFSKSATVLFVASFSVMLVCLPDRFHHLEPTGKDRIQGVIGSWKIMATLFPRMDCKLLARNLQHIDRLSSVVSNISPEVYTAGGEGNN
jgi:hypothetical protein